MFNTFLTNILNSYLGELVEDLDVDNLGQRLSHFFPSKHLKGRLGPPVSNVFWINGGPLGPPVSNVFWINGGPLGPPVSIVFWINGGLLGPPVSNVFGSMEVRWGKGGQLNPVLHQNVPD